jgi:hypothetical protein
MSNPITLGDAYWEHQQLQKQISEQTKKAQLYANFDMNATFVGLLDSSVVPCTGSGGVTSLTAPLPNFGNKLGIPKHCVYYGGNGVQRHFQQYFSYIMAVFVCSLDLLY